MELLLLTIAVLVVGLLIGIPVPFTFFAGTLLIVVAGGYDYTFLLPYAYKQCSSIILMSIPLFIFAGSLMEKGGIGECLVNLVEMFEHKYMHTYYNLYNKKSTLIQGCFSFCRQYMLHSDH